MMRFIITLCLLILLSGCVTLKTPSDYSAQRNSEDNITWEYSARDDMMDLPDGGSTFKSRNINFIGVTY